MIYAHFYQSATSLSADKEVAFLYAKEVAMRRITSATRTLSDFIHSQNDYSYQQ